MLTNGATELWTNPLRPVQSESYFCSSSMAFANLEVSTLPYRSTGIYWGSHYLRDLFCNNHLCIQDPLVHMFYFEDEDVEFLKLRCLGYSRDQIVDETGKGDGTVSRSL